MKKLLQKGIAQIVILGIMGLLAVVLPVATKLVQQNQENRSQAATATVCSASTLGSKKCNSANKTISTCKSVKNMDDEYEYIYTSPLTCSNGCTQLTSTTAQCNSGTPTLVCQVGQYRCNGMSTLEKCNSAGTGWDRYDDCLYGCQNNQCNSAPKVDGQCSSTKDKCLKGDFRDIADSATKYWWTCVGKNGGATVPCSIDIPDTCTKNYCGENSTQSACSACTAKLGCVWGYHGSSSMYCSKPSVTESKCATFGNLEVGIIVDLKKDNGDLCEIGDLVSGSLKEVSSTSKSGLKYVWKCGGNGYTTKNCEWDKKASDVLPEKSCSGTCMTKTNCSSRSGTPASLGSGYSAWSNCDDAEVCCINMTSGPAKCGVSGSVSSLVAGDDLCELGDYSDFKITTTGWTWNCGGGNYTSVPCNASKAIPGDKCAQLKDDAFCISTAQCATGTNLGKSDCKTGETCCWGIQTKIDGTCGTSKLTCKTGTVDDSAVADTSSYYRWVCHGIHGGKDSGTCQSNTSGGGTTTYSITLNPASLNLNVGQGSTVTPTLNPPRATEVFSWTSSDSTVATVFIPGCSDNRKSTVLTDKADYSTKCDASSGSYYLTADGSKQCTKCVGTNYAYIGALKPGKATITVVASPSGATATLQVTVKATGTQITDITLSPNPLKLKVGESGKINVATVPAGITSEYIWTKSQSDAIKLYSNGKVDALKVGEVTVKVAVKGKESISKTVKVIVTAALTPTGTTPTDTLKPTPTDLVPQPLSDSSISFKVAFAGISPNAKCINEYFIPETRLRLEVNNVPTNKFDNDIQSSFERVGNEVDSKGNQIFKVTQTLDKNKFGSVNKFNYVKVKGPWHLKRRMCQDKQSSKLSETTGCDIDLKATSGKVYDFSQYTLLAGDVFDPPDGVINVLDLGYIKTRLDPGAYESNTCGLEGDLNLDRVVNTIDLNLVKDALTERDDE